MNNGETDNTEIVPGDEGELPPIHDIMMEPHGDVGVEPANQPEVMDAAPSDVDDQIPGEVIEAQEVEQQPEEISVSGQPPVTEEPVVPVKNAFEVPEPKSVPAISGWQRVRGLFGSANSVVRLNSLTEAIEDAPESSVNYVLRAETYMSLREYALAQADFQRAIELADMQFELADWGVLAQVMRDRAIAGLEKVQRRLS